MRKSHGDGHFSQKDFAHIGAGCVLEEGVRVFHADRISLGTGVYVGHDTHLKAYFKTPEGLDHSLSIGDGTWIGQQCFFHSAGGIQIGRNVGIGPGVRILTSTHSDAGRRVPLLHADVVMAPVVIEDDCNIGMSVTILPGVRIGRGALIGAGAVVTRDVPPYAVAAGNPAKVLRMRPE